MTVNQIKEMLKSKRKEVQKALEITADNLKELPKGNLQVRSMNGKMRYLKYDGQRQIYLSSQDEKTLREFETANYYVKLNKAAAGELKKIDLILNELERMPDTDRVFFNIDENKRNLIEPLSIQLGEDIERNIRKTWKTKRVDNDNYKTLNGDNVRSKSELIIADRLTHYDVPYLYEPHTLIEGEMGIWHPDFFVLNKNTGAFYYWEHFGLLDNKEYCESFQYKIEKYAESDIYPGINLIITTESSGHMLNTGYIDRLIRKYLL